MVDAADAESMVTLYRPRMLRLCRRILPGNEYVEDACQEALTKAFEALPRFRSGAPMWPWLATITANVCRDLLRREHFTDPIEAADGQVIAWSDPEEVATGRRRARLVTDAIGSLPAAYRTPVYLREVEGWSYAQIAETRGRSLASIRTTLMRGRRLLADRIETLARERREWPLAGVAVLGGLVDRFRAKAARLQASLEGTRGQWWRLDSAFAGIASVPLSFVAPAAAAVMMMALGVVSSAGADASVLPRDEGVADARVPAVIADDPPPAAQPPTAPVKSLALVYVGASQTRADDAPVATPPVEVTAAPGAPADPIEEVSDGTVHVGPVGITCGPQDVRREGMGLLCNALDG